MRFSDSSTKEEEEKVMAILQRWRSSLQPSGSSSADGPTASPRDLQEAIDPGGAQIAGQRHTLEESAHIRQFPWQTGSVGCVT